MKIKVIISFLLLLITTIIVIFIFHFHVNLSTEITYAPDVNFSTESIINGNKIIFEIKKDQISKTPIISSDMKLPLSIDSAIKIASKEFIKYVSDTSQWYIRSIELERTFPISNNWFYEICYANSSNSLKKGNQYLNIPILMDGSVIKAKISK